MSERGKNAIPGPSDAERLSVGPSIRHDLNMGGTEHIEELHENEQYFFDPNTIGKLADFAQGFDHPCCLCVPTLGVELEKRKVAATVLDIDERFSTVKGYQKYDIYHPKRLGMKFGIIICDPPFFSVSLSQQLSAVRLLAQDDCQQSLLICYLAIGSNNIVSTFSPFGVKPTGFRPSYLTVETSEIEWFGNVDDDRLQALTR